MSLAELADALDATLGRQYCPSTLHPKQQAFLRLTELEALYGGAAGGGKSEAVLAGALQYAHDPDFAALILRRSYPDLALPEALMARAHDWLDLTDATWNAVDKRWTFPSGAVLQFGYCDSEAHLARYKSAAFQYIAIDELTEWPEEWYTFLFSRLRRPKGSRLPLRMRAATNPDGPGADWVRARFGIPYDAIVDAPIRAEPGRVFFPARAEDNASLDIVSYDKALRALGPDRYEQLRWGRWRRAAVGKVYASFDEARNVIPRLPDNLLHFVLGIDYGNVDACAWTVWGWRPNDPVLYCVLSFKMAGVIPSEAARITHELEQRFRFDVIVGDVGGLGKGYSAETAARFRVPVQPAQKNNKLGYIQLFNGDLARSHIQVLRGACDELVAEWTKLAWDSRRARESAGQENHCADSALYSWREAFAFVEQEPEPPLPEDERLRRETAAHWQRRRENLQGRKQRPWWDRR